MRRALVVAAVVVIGSFAVAAFTPPVCYPGAVHEDSNGIAIVHGEGGIEHLDLVIQYKDDDRSGNLSAGDRRFVIAVKVCKLDPYWNRLTR